MVRAEFIVERQAADSDCRIIAAVLLISLNYLCRNYYFTKDVLLKGFIKIRAPTGTPESVIGGIELSKYF